MSLDSVECNVLVEVASPVNGLPVRVHQKTLRGFAAVLAMTYQRGRDDFVNGKTWHATALQYEDDDLRFAYICGWTDEEAAA